MIAVAIGCSPRDSPDVLATVDGDPITLDDLPGERQDAESLVRVSNGSDRGRLQTALDRAVRDELLAHEAVRRGHSGSSRAALLSALLAEERRNNPELKTDSISDAQARAWYESNRARFEHIETAQVYWAEFEGQSTAQDVFDASTDVSEPKFKRIVGRSEEVVDHGSAELAVDDDTANALLLRIANAVRQAGEVGMDQDRVEGHWWVVRVESWKPRSQPWDAELAVKVKTAMAFDREQDHLARLAARLRVEWPVEVNEDVVERMREEF